MDSGPPGSAGLWLGLPVGLAGVAGSRSGFAAPSLEMDGPDGSVSDPARCWTLPFKSWFTFEHGIILELLPCLKLSTKLNCFSGYDPD